jgi:transposase
VEEITELEIVWCGLDAAKKKLDAALLAGGRTKSRTFANCREGFQELLRWTLECAPATSQVRFCLEATGDYGVALALYLAEHGRLVCLVNPARVKYYGMAKGRLNKTDNADARLVADYARSESPAPWDLSDPEKRELFRLCRRREQLLEMEGMERNRRECPEAIGETALSSVAEVLKILRAQIRSVEAAIRELVGSSERFRRDAELIMTVPVLGEASAGALLAYMPLASACPSAKSYAAASGTSPACRQSGSRESPARMSRGGSRHVRRVLWMPTLKAVSTMPQIRDFYQRLRQRGKTHKQALVACMRKLLMIVHGILRSGKAYRPPEEEKKEENPQPQGQKA